jgi:hypothetical protein
MSTIIALRRGVSLRIHIERSVRTGLGTGFAADTTTRVKINDAIIPPVQCLDRTDIDTRWLCTMVTPKNSKISSAVRKRSLFDIFHPCSVHTERYLVFGFACNRACMTSDTFSGIDNKTVIHEIGCSKY